MGKREYGYFHPTGDTTVLAHRFAYEAEIGYILPCFELDHICKNKLCVRPSHLEPVTKRENMIRAECWNNLGDQLGRGRTDCERDSLGRFT